ncbi:MAG: hypothetical protein ABI183_11570 [Polyangiaceae bacterium]
MPALFAVTLMACNPSSDSGGDDGGTSDASSATNDSGASHDASAITNDSGGTSDSGTTGDGGVECRLHLSGALSASTPCEVKPFFTSDGAFELLISENDYSATTVVLNFQGLEQPATKDFWRVGHYSEGSFDSTEVDVSESVTLGNTWREGSGSSHVQGSLSVDVTDIGKEVEKGATLTTWVGAHGTFSAQAPPDPQSNAAGIVSISGTF